MAIPARQSDFIRIRVERVFWALALCYIGLVARLVYLQALHGDFYRTTARRLRAQNIPQRGARGDILDRDGRPLAATVYRSVLVADTTRIPNVPRAATAAAQVLGVAPDAIRPHLLRNVPGRKGSPRAVQVPIALTPEAVEAFRLARGNRKLAKDLAGLAITTLPERSYPSGRDSVHVVGFLATGKDGKAHGLMGMERALDADLQGHDGFMRAEVDARRRVIPGTQVQHVEPEDGLDALLTIDSTIQHMVETELAQCCDQYHPVGATAILLDPNNGDVLAMVSWPDFDPIRRKELNAQSDSRASGRGPEVLRNRAITLFEPGSTMKIVTAAAALSEKVITPTTHFHCEGEYRLGNRTIKCAPHGGSRAHGDETVHEVIEHSCNIASAQIGMRLGMQRMEKYLKLFGLLDPTGVGLPYDMRGRLGFGGETDRESLAKVARVAFGQSVMVSPLALAEAYATIANSGVRMRPRLVLGYQDENGRTIRRTDPEPVSQVITPELAAYLRGLLEDVVTSGTGKAAAVPGYSVAGKTGTAQKVVAGSRGYATGKYVASFIGFLPASRPRALVYVVVDEPHGAYYGAQVAAPVFQRIAQRLMWYWKVPPDDPASLEKGRLAKR